MGKLIVSSDKKRISRRAFIGTSAGAAALLGNAVSAKSQSNKINQQPITAGSPSQQSLDRDVGNTKPPEIDKRAVKLTGSDLMVQILKDLNIE